MMGRILLVPDEAKAKMLEEEGFVACGKRDMGGKLVYQFAITDELLDALNDTTKFNKKDYMLDTRLTF